MCLLAVLSFGVSVVCALQEQEDDRNHTSTHPHEYISVTWEKGASFGHMVTGKMGLVQCGACGLRLR